MAMDVTLRQLRAYLAVLEAASFSEAAKTMHLSQAALSGLIKELENRMGVRLLDRTTRSVSRSVVGEAFEPMVRRVLANLDEALESVTSLKELRRGLVRVAAPETLSCTLLPELIASYNSRHPGVDVRFDDVPIQQVLAGLQNGSTDIGFGPAGVMAGHGRRVGGSPHDLRRPAMGGVASGRSADKGRVGQLEGSARPAADQLHAQYRHQRAEPRAAAASPEADGAGAPGQHRAVDAAG